MEKEKKATRQSYGEALLEVGKENADVVVLDADLSSATKTNIFAKELPERFFDIGIAEANMMGTAAGLATCGKIPYASTFAVFAAGRAYDQIRNSICYPNLNVKICATHAGITVGEDGATHQMLEDISMMRTLPNMIVMSTSDDIQTKWAVKEISKINGPVYLRLSRMKTSQIYNENQEFEIGKAVQIGEGTDGTIFATGVTVEQAIKAQEELKKQNIEVRVVDTLESVLWVLLNTEGFNQAVIGAINLGDDTDTIGACTGGLAGIIYGLKSINTEWRIDLRRYTYIRSMCDEFDQILRSSSKKFDRPEPVYGNEEKVVKIILGDITKLNVDAYVNSANNSLLGGNGVDGAIHAAAGPELLEKCKHLNGCETGEAKITRGYKSKAKYIIHTVAPKWYESPKMDKEKVLRKCYENSLALAEDFQCARVAFPCLGMGMYGCPVEISAKIAIDFAVAESRKKNPGVEAIYLICYEMAEYDFYMEYFKEKIKEKK